MTDQTKVMTIKSLCVVSLALSIFMPGLRSPAQAASAANPVAPAADPAAKSDPVDIQANEQEFAEGQIIAKGNVKVTMKDTIVLSPQATLFRDASGQAQRAVFVGHPHLIQGLNKIDATTLIFECATSRVIADGNAHSEVLQDDDGSAAPPAEEDPKTKGAAPGKATVAKGGAGKKGDFAWPTKKSDGTKVADEPEKKPAAKPQPTPVAAANQPAKDSADDSDPDAVEKPAVVKTVTGPAKAPGDKIITDADHQEYERASGHFFASGHVRVHHGEIFVKSDKLQLVYGSDNRPETALFSGNVNAIQNDNNTLADNMTYYLTTQRLQATGNVRSKVIQKRADVKKGGPETPDNQTAADSTKAGAKSSGPVVTVKTAAGEKAKPNEASGFSGIKDTGDPMYITSDAQDYTKDDGRIAAEGNVHLYYGDTIGSGPKALLVRNSDGEAERIIFSGRSLINQPGKRWVGDKITMTCADHHVLAEGNTHAIILQKTDQTATAKPGASSTSAPAKPPAKDSGGSKLADDKKQPPVL